MEPFTLEWWPYIQSRFIRQAFILVYQGKIDNERYEQLREITLWISDRIVNKYGE